MVQYRQGDLLLIKIDKLPSKMEGFKLYKAQHRVLLEGEATGHKHELTSGNLILLQRTEQRQRAEIRNEVIARDGTFAFIEVAMAGTVLVHPEHNSIELPVGIYQVRRQREYNELEDRFVQD